MRPEPPETLTEDLMVEFLDAIARAGGHLADYLLPPLPEGEARGRVLRATGLELPDEAVVWWSFHNGAVPEARYRCLPAGDVMSIEEVIEGCRIMRNVSATYIVDMMRSRLPSIPLFEVWWLPILNPDGGNRILFDASVRPEEPSPIRRYTHGGDVMADHAIVARSIGEMVRGWIRAVDAGWYRFDEERGFWDGSYWEGMTNGQKRSGIL